MKGLPKLHIHVSYSSISVEMWILRPKKSLGLRLFHFSIFSSEIFRIVVELPKDLIYRPGKKFGSQIPKCGGQNSEFGRQIF